MKNLKKILHKINTNKNAKWFLLGGVVVIAAIITLLVIAPWKSEAPPEEPPVIETTPPPADAPSETPATTETPETPEPTPEPRPPANPLTGVEMNVAGEVWTEEMSKSRPWAVAIGNTNIGVPLRGVGSADIICEYLNYSSGETRIMAIYQEVAHVEYIRGIRSLRSASYEISLGYDSIFAHWGGNTYTQKQVPGNPITHLNTFDASWVGMRMDADILQGGSNLENRAGVTGEALVNGLPDNFRKEREGDIKPFFNFTDDGTPKNGTSAENLTVSFATWSRKTTGFSYNAADGLYYASQYGRKFEDLNSGEQISFTNILVVQMPMRQNYNSVGHVYIDTTAGSRPAYYFNGGKCVEIRWARENVEDPFEYFNLDGTPLEIGVGKTYICVVELKDDFEPLSFD